MKYWVHVLSQLPAQNLIFAVHNLISAAYFYGVNKVRTEISFSLDCLSQPVFGYNGPQLRGSVQSTATLKEVLLRKKLIGR